jgi:hypothetical protein
MNQTASLSRKNAPLLALLGLAAALLVAGVLLGAVAEIGMTARTAFFVLVLLGFAMCMLGPLGRGQVYGWWNSRHLAGYLIGSAALLLTAAVLFHLPIPGIPDEQAAILVLATLMLIKVLIAAFYPQRQATVITKA